MSSDERLVAANHASLLAEALPHVRSALFTAPADATTWVYDEPTGLLTSKLDAAGKAVSYTYATQGRLLTRTWARTAAGAPLTTTYSYSPDTGELLMVDYSDATPDVAYTYDRLGRQKTVQDALGSRTFSYTAALQPAVETISGVYGLTLTRAYAGTGVIGRSSGFSLGADYAVTYGYDPTGRMNGLTWTAGADSGGVTYAHLADSDLLESAASTSGVTAGYTYEPHRNLRTRVLNRFNGATVSDYRYAYDALGRRTSVVNEGSAFAQAAHGRYGYNDRSELTAANRYLGTDPGDQSQPVTAESRGYAYDPIGNRRTATEAALQLTYTANQLNQYDLISGGAQQTLDYDDDGNLIGITTGTGTTRYVFDGENRLTMVEPATPADGDKKVSFVYDYLGRRVRKQGYLYSGGSWASTGDTRFVYDGWNLIRELDAAGQPIRTYVWGLDLSQSLQGAGGIGGLLVMKDSSGSFEYLYDANGNVGQLVNAADGTIAANYEYDPYGNAVFVTGAMAEANLYRFSTKCYDSEYGLYYYGYRFFSSRIGRWINKDPLTERGGANLYSFAVNSPIGNVDAWGLKIFVVRRPLTAFTSWWSDYGHTAAIAAGVLFSATRHPILAVLSNWIGDVFDYYRNNTWHCVLVKTKCGRNASDILRIESKDDTWDFQQNEGGIVYNPAADWREPAFKGDYYLGRMAIDTIVNNNSLDDPLLSVLLSEDRYQKYILGGSKRYNCCDWVSKVLSRIGKPYAAPNPEPFGSAHAPDSIYPHMVDLLLDSLGAY